MPTIEQTVYVSKEMLGYIGNQPTNPPGINPGDEGFGLYAPDVTDLNTYLGTETEYYRLNGWQLNGADQFANGQFWSLDAYTGDGDPREDDDPSHWTEIYAQLTPKNDLVNGLGIGDNYIVLEIGGEHIMLDFDGTFSDVPTDVVYEPNRDPGGEGAPTFDEGEDAFDGAVCFAAGTLIETGNSPMRVEDLRVGQIVLTKDHGPQPIRWISSQTLSPAVLARHENLRPVRIKAGALGAGTPSSDLVVSPQHRILVRSKIANRMFGASEILVAAKQLLELDGVEIAADLEEVRYFHILFDRHEIVLSNGAESEAFYTGPQALKSVDAAARAEIFRIFPELKDRDYRPEPARTLVSGRVARNMVKRHIKNDMELVAA
ncbi:Hint domain-containing protein [Paracoccus seriniphilus]|uniref:Hint domain-containing protein n=1 Tax=Paracoccus seriniphilus TaxID=184748 RepID=A0A239Q355_9RHOB|nr:Hint domain-containing protein [Paracoccus seriniphilus]SNT76622.1 Hint domain-containing protein [Paracoccus seriniphilus]